MIILDMLPIPFCVCGVLEVEFGTLYVVGTYLPLGHCPLPHPSPEMLFQKVPSGFMSSKMDRS